MKTRVLLFPNSRVWLLVVALALVGTSERLDAQEPADPPADVTEEAPVDETAPVEEAPPEAGTQGAIGSPPTDTSPVSTSVPQIPGDLLSFQADLFTGRFGYQVPILVPPARRNSQPSIALGYSSSAANGWCGVGWMLDMGFIQRDTRRGVPRGWTGATPNNYYDDSKGFIISFQGIISRLVFIQNVGADKEYRAEVDYGTFLKFLWKSAGHWEVTDKSGDKFYFGESSASRMENPKFVGATVAQKTFRWSLNRVEDVNGNKTTLSYTTHSNQLYLAEIAYNASTQGSFPTNTVTFTLTNRTDSTVSFIPGYRVETRQLLKEIVVKAHGQNVRKYSLTYTNSPGSYRSLLASVTQFGTNFTSSLPPLRFSYQTKPFEFDVLSDWMGVYSQGQGGADWNTVRDVDGDKDSQVEFVDMDGDALPDRIMRDSASPYQFFAAQRNTSTNFVPNTGSYTWTPLENQGQTDKPWNSLRAVDGNNATHVELLDINGDAYPDRIMRQFADPHTNFVCQLNLGYPGYTSATNWVGVTSDSTTQLSEWRAIRDLISLDTAVELLDINGDGLPDRILRRLNIPYDRFRVQPNTGTGFGGFQDWTGVNGQGDTSASWNSPFGKDGTGTNTKAGLFDINGDGLPDRVMRKLNSPYNQFAVQFNNGVGFEPWEYWGGTVDTQGQGGDGWGSPVGSDGVEVFASLADINGDGLLDRVMRQATGPTYTTFKVQLNTGMAFTNTVTWTGVDAEDSSQNWRTVSTVNSSGDTKVDFLDINGDGLPDRVMRKRDPTHDRFKVQLNKGPAADLLSSISNSIGGKVEVAYVASTKYDNRDRPWPGGDPWTVGALSLLPFPVYTVSSIVVYDGFGSADTNKHTYAGGVFDIPTREFRGFHRVTATDPLGTKSITYFHQGGGTNDTVNGEYNDQSSLAKKGMPYRVEVFGNVLNPNRFNLTLHKVDEVQVYASDVNNRWCFPFVSQTIQMEYEGESSYRANCKQFQYDARLNDLTSTGNLLKESNRGEVTSVSFSDHTFQDLYADSVYSHIAYASVCGSGDIKNKPDNSKVTSDSNGTQILREARFVYDCRGNVTKELLKLGSGYVTNSFGYDLYGNITSRTNPVGIATKYIFDPTYQTFPITNDTETFTNSAQFDVRSGQMTTATDAKGLVSSATFDVFFRPTETSISTNAFGPAVLWRTRMGYNLGGIVGGNSQNCITNRMFDAVDLVNGQETFTYFDGLGRKAQVRAESEVAGSYRVTDTLYDERGNPNYQTRAYSSSGIPFTAYGGQVGTLTEFDAIGRVFRVTPPAGDTGSPTGPETVEYKDGTNPWATITTDAENKTRKSYTDAYGRVIQITEQGGYNTYFGYDKIGNLTNVTDNAGNKTWMNYDGLGRKTSMIDPDMGTWTYNYDPAGRMTEQFDAKNQKLKFIYNDPIGRLTSKEIYNGSGVLQTNITYIYDVSDDSSCPCFKGQLYKVSDRQGYQKNCYDVRGRVLKTVRNLSVNGQTYEIQSTYDDADRVKEVTYPGNATKLRYTYDTAGNVQKVESLCGTGGNVVFYKLGALSELGQILNYTNGNTLVTSYSYYTNSKRLQQMKTPKPVSGFHHDLTYTYDKVSNIKSIADGAYAGQSGDATLSSITYDGLHRLQSYTRSSTTFNFSYTVNGIGNINVNPEFGGGTYSYGSSKPHAVTMANGKSYSYDSCGNMTNRYGSALIYDEENQLKQVSGTNTVTFGYAEGGARLWKNSGGALTVWIGGIYEINGGKTLCHVFAGPKRIATFEPQSPLCAIIRTTPALAACRSFFVTAGTWPLQHGRAPFTVTLIPLLGIFCATVFLRWRDRFRRRRPGGVLCRAVRGFAAVTPRPLPASSPDPALGATAGLHSPALTRRYSRRYHRYLAYDPIAASPIRRFAVSFTSVLLVVATFVAFTPTDVEAQVCNPIFWYYQGDHLGSSNILTDSSGNLVRHYEYHTFGNKRFTDTTCAFDVSNRFTGQILDEDTGLYYYGARYYDPEVARFVQADPIVPSPGNPQTLNRYSYVNNNPLKYVDPSGHFLIAVIALLTTAGVVGAAIGAGLSAARGGSALQGAYAGLFVGGWAGLAPDNVQQIIIQAGQAVLSIVAIVVGVITANPLAVTAGVLSLGSQAAGLAGDEQLSAALGYTALVFAVAQLGLSVADFVHNANVESSASSTDQVTTLSGETNSASAKTKPVVELPDTSIDKPIGTGKADAAIVFGSADKQGTSRFWVKTSQLEELTQRANAGEFEVYTHVSKGDLEIINAKYKSVTYIGHGQPTLATNPALRAKAVQIPGTNLRGGKGLLVDLTTIKGFAGTQYSSYQCYNALWNNAGLPNLKVPLAFRTPIGGPGEGTTALALKHMFGH